MFIKIFLFLLTIATPIFSNPIILDSDWEILEEKYERKDGVPEEVLNPKNFKWKQISRNETALNSENKKYKLIRIPIKEHSFKEPVIFLNRNIFSIRVFQNKKIIYKFSDDKQFLPSSFLGWIWHEIILKKEKKVSYIYFEFYSEIDFPFPIPLLYEREEFKREFIKNNLMSFFISIFSILLGIFLLINYFFKTKEYIYLSLASFYIFLGTWLLNIHEFIQYLVPITPTRLQIEYLSMYVSPVFALWFIELNFPSRANKISKIIRYFYFSYAIIFGLLDIAKIFPLWKTLIPYNTTLVIGLTFYLYRVGREIVRGKVEAKILSVGIILLIFCVIHDVFVVMGLISNSMIMHFGTFALIISKGGVALYKISMMNKSIKIYSVKLESKNKRLKRWSQELELKVQERTKEVTEKMNEIQQLKIHQDGDYFLTSLIVKPLTKIDNNLKKIEVETYIKQKKQFEFRKRSSELGGDLIIVQNLKFHQYKNNFLFFCNADAMGKSMQGATGAIVAGTVINNLLARVKNSEEAIALTPSNFLEEMYYEMDKLFRTFRSSMLISAVCGLIEERTKKMYFFNAEHPNLILYRDNVASTIKLKSDVRKLGTEVEQNFYVESIRLKKGDILFCGSDGKDDIEIDGMVESDEDRFLNCIEKAEGDLAQIIEEVNKQGNVIDDQSILKIKIL